MIQRSSNSDADSLAVKTEEAPLSPNTERLLPPETPERRHTDSIGKRKRTSTVQYVDLDPESENEAVSRRVKVEKLNEKQEIEPLKPQVRKRKAHIGRYLETCRHFQKELTNLGDPKRIPQKILLESYKQSRDLNIFMKTEYDEVQSELVKLKALTTQVNAKVKSLRTDLSDAKKAREAAEVQAKVHEKNFQDANLQLTLKLARPLSNAQIKLESVHQDYADEMAELRKKLIEARKAEDSVPKNLAIAQPVIIPQSLEAKVRTAEMQKELHELRLQLVNMQKLKEDLEASVNAQIAANLQAKSNTQDLKAESASLKLKVDSAMATAAAEITAKEAAQKKVEKLEKKVEEQSALLKEQIAAFAVMENNRKLFQPI